MKERFFIFGSLALLAAALVGLNAASYVQREKIPDSEAMPHRSTYNTGPTGTRAFHDLLASTGQQVERWERPVSDLNGSQGKDITTLVIVGTTRREITDIEIEQLLEWVNGGGNLVIVDRAPMEGLLQTTGAWTIDIIWPQDAISDNENDLLLPTVDPANSKQMTDGENAAKPLQPTAFTLDVTAVQPSKFATSIQIEKVKRIHSKQTEPPPTGVSDPVGPPPPVTIEQKQEINPNSGNYGTGDKNKVPPKDKIDTNGKITIEEQPSNDANTSEQVVEANTEDEEEYDYTTLAPVIHVGNKKKNLLAEFPYGYGTIAVLTDPYLISNGGVNLVDNAVLGLNLLSTGGTIAFDEFHQGYGSDQNRLLSYFNGTPVVPVFLQLCLLLGLLMVSQSRRFARPLPMREKNRLSKLEYVAAMAQLKRRTKAFDLAIENIYTDFRRRISRLAGLENSRSRNRDFAAWIAKRTDYKTEDVYGLIAKCEDIMHGESTTKKEVLALSTKIREIEKALGLRRGRNAFGK